MVQVRRQQQQQEQQQQEQQRVLRCILWLILSCLSRVKVSASEFEPYRLNGGLIAAVSGRDYCLIATDTRLIGESGYDILERRHLQSRVWSVCPRNPRLLFGADGSLLFPSLTTKVHHQHHQPSESNGSGSTGLESTTTYTGSEPMTQSPVLIGSAGCQADCEFLKRTMRYDVRRALESGEMTMAQLCGRSVAATLSQMLYSRRGFPWYAFCVVAGLEEDGGGQVYVFDAIGSYEAVAVATSGTGRELLQPILDRSFSSATSNSGGTSNKIVHGIENEDGCSLQSLTIHPPRVRETAQEAAMALMRAFRAVSERQATLGDNVVLCCVQRRPDGTVHCWTQSVPLKIH